jgi:hypothetical protein
MDSACNAAEHVASERFQLKLNDDVRTRGTYLDGLVDPSDLTRCLGGLDPLGRERTDRCNPGFVGLPFDRHRSH